MRNAFAVCTDLLFLSFDNNSFGSIEINFT